ncbi:MAG TPA: ABC transporter ATP-binding protein [Gaiellaceae bacterium]|nr:ABC transporter ATP-binding protein [Gaiellaceae bacterium]
MELDLTVPLRSFALELSLETGAETLALVGPSGAGKTTLLRTIAGLVRPSRGRIAAGGDTWFDSGAGIDLPPEERSVGLVFQDYALFPHLTVEENVRFGARGAVDDALERLGIDALAGTRPGELSGGERQRVALARALGREPKVLLLDEPLAALDAPMRTGVRSYLRGLLGELGLPTLLVTHDYADAVALAGRVGVLVGGRLVQLGTPTELLTAPATPFVADLVGGNLLVGRAERREDGLTQIELEDGTRVLSTDEASGEVALLVYPWEITLARAAGDDSSRNHVRGTVEELVPLGNRVRVRVGPLTAEVTAASAERLGLRIGEPVVASFKATGARVLGAR